MRYNLPIATKAIARIIRLQGLTKKEEEVEKRGFKGREKGAKTIPDGRDGYEGVTRYREILTAYFG